MGYTSDCDSPIVTDEAVTVRRTQQFMDAAYKVTSHMSGLPLSSKQHNKLVQLITEQVTIAEGAAFRQGISLGARIGRGVGDGASTAPPVTGPMQ